MPERSASHISTKSMKNHVTKAKDKQAPSHGPCFYGSTVVGQRGQIVIPKEARIKFSLKPGDQLIVLGHPGKGMMLAKAEALRKFAQELLKEI